MTPLRAALDLESSLMRASPSWTWGNENRATLGRGDRLLPPHFHLPRLCDAPQPRRRYPRRAFPCLHPYPAAPWASQPWPHRSHPRRGSQRACCPWLRPSPYRREASSLVADSLAIGRRCRLGDRERRRYGVRRGYGVRGGYDVRRGNSALQAGLAAYRNVHDGLPPARVILATSSTTISDPAFLLDVVELRCGR